MLASLPIASPLLFWGFVGLSIIVAGGVVVAIGRTSGKVAGKRAAIVALFWLGSTGYLGASGHLDAWEPPRVGFLFVAGLGFLAWAARQTWTERLGDLPLKLLVGFQAFRIIVELLLHTAVNEGVANPTMTWTGTNLDIIPGVTALLLLPFVDRLDRRVLQGWNLVMAGVLVVTVATGMMAAPSPFRQFMADPPNVFIAGFPFVWLPAILVTTAWLGHIVLFRRLRRAPAAAE